MQAAASTTAVKIPHIHTPKLESVCVLKGGLIGRMRNDDDAIPSLPVSYGPRMTMFVGEVAPSRLARLDTDR